MSDKIEKIRASYDEPSIGSAENPYVLFVPGWLEDRYVAEGTTAQAAADRLFRYKVRVEVVR